MAQPMVGQMLQDPAAEPAAPVAEPEAVVAEPAADVGTGATVDAMGQVEAEIKGAATAAAGTGPGAAAMRAPEAEACANPCLNTACTSNAGMGCYVSLGQPPMVTWECQCPPPPPPPVVGSPEWINSKEQQIVDPGVETAAVGPNLAMYETGKIAVNLNAYLKASADRTKTQGEIENLIYKVSLKCELECRERQNS